MADDLTKDLTKSSKKRNKLTNQRKHVAHVRALRIQRALLKRANDKKTLKLTN